jgi:hypothetical protein
MKESISFLCTVLARLKIYKRPLYDRLQFYFIGTSYAPAGQGHETVVPLAKNFEVGSSIYEKTDRIGYFEALFLMKKANALLIIGSDDKSYNPSKIYTYALAAKPVIGIFKSDGPAVQAIKNCCEGLVVKYELKDAANRLELFLETIANQEQFMNQNENPELILHSGEELTRKQCILFDQVING